MTLYCSKMSSDRDKCPKNLSVQSFPLNRFLGNIRGRHGMIRPELNELKFYSPKEGEILINFTLLNSRKSNH